MNSDFFSVLSTNVESKRVHCAMVVILEKKPMTCNISWGSRVINNNINLIFPFQTGHARDNGHLSHIKLPT